MSLFGADRPEFTGSWRGAGSFPRPVPARHQARVGTNWVGPGGHVVHYPVRARGAAQFRRHLERDDWRVETWTVQGTKDEFVNDSAGWNADIHEMHPRVECPTNGRCSPAADAGLDQGARDAAGRRLPSTLPMLAQGAVDGDRGRPGAGALHRQIRRAPDGACSATRRRAIERANRAVAGAADNARRFHNPDLANAAGAEAYVDARVAGGARSRRATTGCSPMTPPACRSNRGLLRVYTRLTRRPVTSARNRGFRPAASRRRKAPACVRSRSARRRAPSGTAC